MYVSHIESRLQSGHVVCTRIFWWSWDSIDWKFLKQILSSQSSNVITSRHLVRVVVSVPLAVLEHKLMLLLYSCDGWCSLRCCSCSCSLFMLGSWFIFLSVYLSIWNVSYYASFPKMSRLIFCFAPKVIGQIPIRHGSQNPTQRTPVSRNSTQPSTAFAIKLNSYQLLETTRN